MKKVHIIAWKQLFTLSGDTRFYISSLTYYLGMSFFPLLTLLLSTFQIFQLDSTFFENLLSLFFPNDFLFSFGGNVFLQFGFSSLLSLYIASKGAENFLWYCAKKYQRKEEKHSFFLNKARSIAITLLLSFLLFLLFFSLVALDQGLQYLSSFLRIPLLIILLFGFLFLLILFFYWLAFHTKESWKDLWQGAFVAAFCLGVASLGFSFYVQFFANYPSYYGPITSFIVLLITLYVMSYCLLLGVEWNYQKKIKKHPLSRMLPKD